MCFKTCYLPDHYSWYGVCEIVDGRHMIQYEGCFADIVNKRDLLMKTTLISSRMTHRMCFNHCRRGGYTYMGLQVNNKGCLYLVS